MQNRGWRGVGSLLLLSLIGSSFAQQPSPLTWEQVRNRFEVRNPTLLADKLNIDESKAEEITANLRPNPSFSLTADGTQIAPNNGVWQPFVGTFISPGISFEIERRRKRYLRLESAQKGTVIAEFTHADVERGLIFNLRSAFVAILQAKAERSLAQDDLGYWDKVLDISRTRFSAGDIAQIDLDRLELQRAQYESDLQAAEENEENAKIQLLTLLDDRMPLEQFDVVGPYEFNDELPPLDDVRKTALDTRPDLKASVAAVDKARTDHTLAVANGSTDPTLSFWYTHNGSYNNPAATNTLGASINIPLRLFDRNQGEKLRTQLDIDRNQRLYDATQAQVFADVDSSYATVESDVTLLRPYRAKYLDLAVRVRETVTFSYQHGGASLLDFLNAQSQYRSTQMNYINLVASYLTAVAQLNMAAGREVIQ